MAKPKKPSPDLWEKIRVDYLRGVKPRELERIHGVPAKTISNRASADGWKAQREETGKIAGKILPEKVAEAIADAGATWASETLEMATALRRELMEARQGHQTKVVGSMAGPEEILLRFLNEPKDWRAFVAAFSDLDKVARQSLGLDGKKGAGDEPDSRRGEASDTDAVARAILESIDQAPPGE